jgi:hypothetical protein
MSMAALPLPPPLPHRCRDGGGGAVAAAIFFEDIEKCMNLIEF